MSVCLECGLEEKAWPHSVNHPAVSTRPEAHLFVGEAPKLGVPTKREHAKHREFVPGDIAIWTYPHARAGQAPLRVKIVGFGVSDRGTKLYELVNHEDQWDTATYSCRAQDLKLVTWELSGGNSE
jgi:hypothetical protein